MFKSVLMIFNPKNWRAAKVVTGSRGIFASIGRSAAVGWRGFRNFALRNKTLLLGIGAGVTSGLIVRGIAAAFAKVEKEDSKKTTLYSRVDRGAAVALKRKNLCSEMISATESLMYSSEFDRDMTQNKLTVLINSYHIMLQTWVDDDTVDFAVTTDRVLGGAARCGVTIEDRADSQFVLSRLRVLKDDDSPDVLDEDLTYLLYLDSTTLPLEMI